MKHTTSNANAPTDYRYRAGLLAVWEPFCSNSITYNNHSLQVTAHHNNTLLIMQAPVWFADSVPPIKLHPATQYSYYCHHTTSAPSSISTPASSPSSQYLWKLSVSSTDLQDTSHGFQDACIALASTASYGRIVTSGERYASFASFSLKFHQHSSALLHQEKTWLRITGQTESQLTPYLPTRLPAYPSTCLLDRQRSATPATTPCSSQFWKA